jgi:ribosomal-protein-alanine N-acetyltransferase
MKSDAAGVHIRRMCETDLDQVMTIAAGLKDAPHWLRAAYLSALDNHAMPRRIALVAEDTFPRRRKREIASDPQVERDPETGRVVGFLVASLLVPQAELESIAVLVAEQRRGIGRELLLAMREEIRVAGVREVLLEVRASNLRALDFYRSMGWNETGRRPRYYADPEEDAVLMSLIPG